MKITDQEHDNHGNDDPGNGDRRANKIGVLITNLGTPDSVAVGDVRRYLREFLWDRRVIEAPRVLWWLVLNFVVLVIRPRKSARAYRKIWGDDGSPLLAIARRQRRKLQQHLQQHFGQQRLGADCVTVALGMRYGNPSIRAALDDLHAAGARKLLVLPLYPQYSATTTASTFDAVGAALSGRRRVPALRFINHYHDHPGYIAALARRVREYRRDHGASEILLMSFHGIPRAYFEAGDPYPNECRKTAQLLAAELGLEARAWRVSFQSRFGPTQWMQPYTDETLRALAADGVRSVQVVCPGFSADCLETLEEIAMENRAVFLRAGGEKYAYIPCLNDDDAHIAALADIITGNCGDWITDAARDAAARDDDDENRA